MTQSFTCQNLTPQANYFSLSVSLVSSLLSSSLILSSAVQFFKTVRRKFRSAPVTSAKSPIVQRQMAVTKSLTKPCVYSTPEYNGRTRLCVSFISTVKVLSGKAQPEKQLRSSGRCTRDLKLIPIVKQMGRKDFFSRIDSLRHGVRRHTCQ